MANSATRSLKPFYFKQFSVNHSKSSMPVGTDAVLLGATVTLNNPERVLDVGTGCGIVALILAQRLPNSTIDAIDIDLDSTLEAEQNFQESPWYNRLTVTNTSFQNHDSQPYNLIISNPPYFPNSYPILSESRKSARTHDKLSFLEFLTNAERLISTEGEIAVVLSNSVVSNFIEIAQNLNWFVFRSLEISSNDKKPASLYVLQLKRYPAKLLIEKLKIREGGIYSAEYLELMKPYYLFA